MTPVQTTKMSNFRWVICALLFLATTVNYMDRQVLSLTWKDFIAVDFHWTDADYGKITGLFSLFYAIANLFSGKFIDWMGTKKGYLIAIFVWSTGAVMHAGCGWVAMNIEGYDSIEALRMVQAGSDAAVAIATISVWLFLSCRMILAVGEAGNFPAAIKATAEYFPKKDRAFSTSIFNSGASVGALAAPATIPLLARAWGWEMAFIIIGALGFIWMGLWTWLYDKPAKNPRVNQAELNYIEQDNDIAESQDRDNQKEEKTIPFFKCFTYKQTWSFLVGKFMTDGVWWFFLFWAPAYFSDQYGYTSDSAMGIALIFTLYAIVTILSIGGGYLPTYFVDGPHACHVHLRLLPRIRSVCSAYGSLQRLVACHSDWSAWCWSPGLVSQPLLYHWRHVPQVYHRYHRRSGHHGWRYRLYVHQPGFWPLLRLGCRSGLCLPVLRFRG